MHVSRIPLISRLPALCVGLVTVFAAQAHLMVAQHGTLNLTDDGVYMVLSVPVTAFHNVDDNGDGLLSAGELQSHHGAILAQALQGITLIVDGEEERLRGPLLSPTFGHGRPAHTAAQIVVTGRFPVPMNATRIQFRAELFGTGREEKSLTIRFNRPELNLQERAILSPDKRSLLLK